MTGENRTPKRSRRAQRPAPEGVDPHPSEHPLTSRANEDRPEAWGEEVRPKRTKRRGGSEENDDRLRQDRPPHWG